ncbi:MAG: transposase, partial [Ktedonobacteraceae bacterium]|nr:transposase [Ktedonobacteraceae bacterium]
MNQSTTNLIPHFTGSASLAALGIKIRKLDVLEPIRKLVSIPQKTVKDSPFEKLSDAFISILAGASGLVEVNTRLRSDRALQLAFGRSRCAEQSVIQQTLSACTADTIKQMEQATDQIYQRHSQGYQHDY